MATRARASSASSMAPAPSAAGGAREEDHALRVRRNLRILPDQLGLAPAAARVGGGDRRPHPLVELAAKLLHEALLVLAHPRVALGEEHLAVTGLHAQEL